MANPANYFKPGQSGNLKGRPKREWTVKGMIEDAMEEDDATGQSSKKVVYNKLVSMAKRGDVIAIKELNNRLDGMSTQKNEVSGPDGGPIEYNNLTDDQITAQLNEIPKD